MSDSNVSIAGLSKAVVLAALYNASKPQGMGFMHYDPTPLSEQDAQAIIEKSGLRFDYLIGRVMKIDLSGDEIRPDLYDRYNGDGQVAKIVALLSVGGSPADEALAEHHRAATKAAALHVDEHLHDKNKMAQRDGHLIEFELGLDDAAEFLRPHLDSVLGVKPKDTDKSE